jgi:hypothetical protein
LRDLGSKIGSRMATYYAKKYNARHARRRALGRLPLLGSEKTKAPPELLLDQKSR